MLSYPSALSVSTRALITLTNALQRSRNQRGTRWRRLPIGRHALLALAHLRKGETYPDLAAGFGVGTTTAFRYIREAIDVLAAAAPNLTEAIAVARRKAFVILDGTLLRIDRVAMASGCDRPYYSGKWKCHGMNVQVISDPAGRLVWAAPALPGARHDMGAAREHGIIDALTVAGVQVVADSGYRGAGAMFRLPQRRRPADRDTGERRRPSPSQREINAAHAAQRGPGERANAMLKSWKIRCCPQRTTALVNAIQTLILAG
ncbi:IS5/IS1182 family transposase [Pseudonocardia sp. HH130629-09]|uniref:IS5/IS1182 family transposase n=1 Tax=Pseudonocardia sp. HH130629-09 TaxID=1641402 RepID=UPI0006CB08FA|nr:IS5/IS1182 family transposase [Pseudonocardia sp. HH130629-09]ALE84535.1 transposase [Pseudonocardia sp. HH130629-09]